MMSNVQKKTVEEKTRKKWRHQSHEDIETPKGLSHTKIYKQQNLQSFEKQTYQNRRHQTKRSKPCQNCSQRSLDFRSHKARKGKVNTVTIHLVTTNHSINA